MSRDGTPVNGQVISHYIAQKSRGTQGYGFAMLGPNGTVITKRATEEEGIMDYMVRCHSSVMAFHHRMPSSTHNVIESCHPFKVQVGDRILYLIHNGIIHNADELRKDHEALGFSYVSAVEGKATSRSDFNDSEALAWDLGLTLLGPQEKMRAEGMIAFVAVEADISNRMVKIHYGHNDNAPLKFKDDGESVVIGSETPGTSVQTDRLYSLDFRTGESSDREFVIPSYSYHPPKHIPAWSGKGTGRDVDEEYYYSDHGGISYSGKDGWKPAKEVMGPGVVMSLINKFSHAEGQESDGRRAHILSMIEDAQDATVLQWITMAGEKVERYEDRVYQKDDFVSSEDIDLGTAWWWFYLSCEKEMELRYEIDKEYQDERPVEGSLVIPEV